MGLKQDIVIVNQFSVPLPGGRGTRGGTPGKYVTRYLARAGATESLAPIRRLRTDLFIQRYLVRESAVEHLDAPGAAVADALRQAPGHGGVAFGYGAVSLSDDQLTAASRDIQRGFEQGRTVLKTVLSFDGGYLARHGLVDDGFRLTRPGDYRGRVDQMKLRLAIMHGLERMARGSGGFDDLRYVGVIQVDTAHLHAHLAMYDAGPGRRTPDGSQRGMLLERHRTRLRRGIDTWLEQKQPVHHLSSAVGYERRNVTTYIKRWAHERIRDETLPQFLLACLPADRTLWRAGSRDPRMRKANQLVHELVEEQLTRAGSPLPAALEALHAYARERRDHEQLDPQQGQRLVTRGRARITERAVNGVYQLLRALPEEELRVRTPVLEIMGMDFRQLAARAAAGRTGDAAGNDLVSFGFRLRSYASRLRHHRERAGACRDLARQWEHADRAGVATPDSRPLYDFWRGEEDWHRRLLSKYQHFLPFALEATDWADRQAAVTRYGQRLLSLTALRHDAALARMTDAERAEQLGRTIYDQPGGAQLTRGPAGRAVLDARIATMRRTYRQRVADLRADLAGAGLVLHLDPVGSPAPLRVEPGTLYPFEEVKALDLHHLTFDFTRDVVLGPHAAATFREAAARRATRLRAAIAYLDGSGQSPAIGDLPTDDIAAMTRTAGSLSAGSSGSGPVLRSRIARLRAAESAGDARRSATTTLDAGLAVHLRERVDAAVREPAALPLLLSESDTSINSLVDANRSDYSIEQQDTARSWLDRHH
ncbi:relaxase MobL [Granulicoccus phenolivorans]|uniref:relaxase MobL n=1 Tax=Granulicoccus phenolivorans TaxID=266854 RepID=UPI0003FEE042|nr:relaxase MobL [Granulicoccus phenolivorans]